MLTTIVATPQRHQLAVAIDDSDELIIVCTACGSYASRVPRDLRVRCTRKLSATGVHVLERLRSGRHPDSRSCARVGPLLPVTHEMMEDASRAADLYHSSSLMRGRESAPVGADVLSPP